MESGQHLETIDTGIVVSRPLRLPYPYYVLAMLWLVALLRLVDLQIIAVLLQSIKTEFGFSDTQLGMLSGLAFALFYSTLGVPIAYLADRHNRTTILSACLGLWSLMTALCGMVTSYGTFFLARVGVGIGEAGGYPTSTSILSDYFPAEKRGRVFAILGSAVPVGVFFSFVVGGYINAQYGWRMAYLAVGIPGILLALLIKLTVREPLRGASDGTDMRASPDKEALLHTFRELWLKKDYCWVIVGAAFATMAATGSGIWMPSFFTRVHGMDAAEVGIWMGVMYGAGGTIGTLSGGWLSDALSQKYNSRKWFMLVCCLSLLGVLPFALLAFTTSSLQTALLAQFCVIILMHMNVGPVLAMIQNMVGVSRRSMGQSVNVLFSNLIGLALGPVVVGFFSDVFTPVYGDVALGYSILSIYVFGYLLAALCFYFAARAFIRMSKLAA